MARLEPEELARRAEIARRLKAARWLAGTVEPSAKGKTGYAVAELTQVQLAQHPDLRANEITASLIGAIERMERPPRPMELEQIALALGQPPDYFRALGRVKPSDEDLRRAAELLGPQLLAAAQALLLERDREQQGTGARGRPAAGEGGGAG